MEGSNMGEKGMTKGKIHPVRYGLLLILSLVLLTAATLTGLAQEEGFSVLETGYFPSYGDVLADWIENGYGPADFEGTVVINGASYSAKSDNAAVETRKNFEGKEAPTLLWTNESGWIEWEINVPVDGLYWIGIEYWPLPGRVDPGRSIVREIMIDGEYPFKEARNIVFYRQFKDEGKPRTDLRGDEVRPKQVEVYGWISTYLEDPIGIKPGPIQIYLTKGRHTIRLIAKTEPFAISRLWLESPKELPTYKEVYETYKDVPRYSGEDKIIEGEHLYLKSVPALRQDSSRSAEVYPSEPPKRLLNIFGGWRWRNGREWAEWKFEVPEDGLYKIGMQVLQDNASWMPSYRMIEIDGQVPFEGLDRYMFKPSNHWKMEVLSNEDGEPYLFYLTKGEHILRMTPVIGPLESTMRALEATIFDVSALNNKINMILGENPDLNFEWELEKQIPELLPTLEEIAKIYEREAKYVVSVTGGTSSLSNYLVRTSEQLFDMVEYPDTIPSRRSVLQSLLTSVADYITQIKQVPLAVDRIRIGSPDAQWKDPKVSIFRRLYTSWLWFLKSFDKSQGDIGKTGGEEHSTVIKLWVARGREWSEVLKELIEDDFTPNTGIAVDIMTLPSGAGVTDLLKLAIYSGDPPDLVFGVPAGFPVEMAIRGKAYNLNQFEDYEEVTKRFVDGILVPFHWMGADYALPETMDFQVLFYRKDIFQRLGFKVPETWEEVYELIPQLRLNNLWFANAPGYPVYLFKYGGKYYNDDYTASALNSPEGLAALTEWTDVFAKYRVPIAMNFFQHFRVGDMPVGIGGFGMYVQLSAAASEISGRWGMAPLPGTRLPDGTIARWAPSGSGSVAMIFQDSKNKEAAWELMKWWTSTHVQETFAQEIEAYIGIEARWNTANYEALKRLPWSEEEIAVIAEQYKWTREVPEVLGGYMTTRQVDFMWNNVVIRQWTPLDALEDAVWEINRELERKRKEFGLTRNR